MDGKFTGLASKVLSIAKKAAPIAGAAHAWLGDPMADGRGLEGAPQFIWSALEDGLFKGKIANPLTTTKIALGMPGKYPIFAGAGAFIGGMIAEEVGDAVGEGKIKSLGTILKRYGSSAALNSIVSAWVYLSRWNPHGEGQGFTAGGAPGAGWAPYTRGRGGPPDTIWQSRATAQIRSAAGAMPSGTPR